MDFNLRELSGLINGTTTYMYGPDELRPFFDNADLSLFPKVIGDNNPQGNPSSNFSSINVRDSAEFCEITSDAALNYISRMLLEEHIDEKASEYREEAALRVTEKHFYDILGQKYPPSRFTQQQYSNQSPTCNNESNTGGGGGSSNGLVDNSRDHHFADCSNSIDFSSQPLISTGMLPDSHVESHPALQFRKGVEEARKFLPSFDNLVVDFNSTTLSFPLKHKKDGLLVKVKAEEEEDVKEHLIYGSRVRKNPRDEDSYSLEGRNNKLSAVYSDDPTWNEMLDEVLLCQGEKHMEDAIQLREHMENKASKNSQNGLTKGSNRGKNWGGKQTDEEMVDLRTLLLQCARAIADDKRRKAKELLNQIWEHSSPDGDESQRLAHRFADGLEARLAGTGSEIYHKLMAKRATTSDMLRAYRLYLAACPFKRASHYFSNQTILNVIGKASKVHVVDYGVWLGFKWPSLIQRLSKREGGPPKLRITGIDVPKPGFRPTEQVEETGRRLADYAREFKVPFEYQAIACKWETIHVEDINIDKDEVLIVCCLYRFKNLGDETVNMDSPKDRVLNTIRQMNPSVFILAIVNGSYSTPFFVTRFKELLFHYAAIFDMLDANVPRDNEERLLLERDIFGRDAFNAIACEGSGRIERPETYKKWQARILKARFVQLPPNPSITKKIKDKVRANYHKDFMIDEDSGWLLQGWKGRIIYALSTWKPSET